MPYGGMVDQSARQLVHEGISKGISERAWVMFREHTFIFLEADEPSTNFLLRGSYRVNSEYFLGFLGIIIFLLFFRSRNSSRATKAEFFFVFFFCIGARGASSSSSSPCRTLNPFLTSQIYGWPHFLPQSKEWILDHNIRNRHDFKGVFVLTVHEAMHALYTPLLINCPTMRPHTHSP